MTEKVFMAKKAQEQSREVGITVAEADGVTSSMEADSSQWEVQVHSLLSITSAVRYVRFSFSDSRKLKKGLYAVES